VDRLADNENKLIALLGGLSGKVGEEEKIGDSHIKKIKQEDKILFLDSYPLRAAHGKEAALFDKG
jgi:hypothetical protein